MMKHWYGEALYVWSSDRGAETPKNSSEGNAKSKKKEVYHQGDFTVFKGDYCLK